MRARNIAIRYLTYTAEPNGSICHVDPLLRWNFNHPYDPAELNEAPVIFEHPVAGNWGGTTRWAAIEVTGGLLRSFKWKTLWVNPTFQSLEPWIDELEEEASELGVRQDAQAGAALKEVRGSIRSLYWRIAEVAEAAYVLRPYVNELQARRALRATSLAPIGESELSTIHGLTHAIENFLYRGAAFDNG